VSVRSIDPEALRVGRVLRAIREQQGLTQAQVAAGLKKGEGAYAAYEAGRSRFTLPELPIVAQALKVSTAHVATRLGFCGVESDDIASALVERFGPQIGGALVRIDRVLARMEHDDASAITVMMANTASKYELRHG
jgi:transcriptional regulator with XRE-family HTH domain